ncbi:MAG TPA: penicillin-binding protein 2 [bacterium]|nr:penicillin-binding protein 2 [bacterium]HPT29862.1 penicillin-binding protein 2 [bacterium]
MSINPESLIKKKRHSNPFLIRSGKIPFANLEDPVHQSNWAEESFLSGDHEKDMLRRTFDLDKRRYIVGFLILFLVVLVSRVFWLQVVRGQYYYSLAEGNRLKVVDIEAKRGIIYDRNLKPLVRNEANFLLYVIPNQLPADGAERDAVIKRLSLILTGGKPGEIISSSSNLELIADDPVFYDLKSQIDKVKINSLDAYQPLFLGDNLDYDIALRLYLEADRTPGVYLATKIRRHYFSGHGDTSSEADLSVPSLSHILGYTGKINAEELAAQRLLYSPIDYLGKTGLEYSYENELRGEKGKKNIEVDALGREKKIVSQVEPQNGHHLQLSLDLDLQQKAESVLADVLARNGKSRGSLIAINPNNGEVLALVSWPPYNNNDFAKGISTQAYQKLTADPDHPLFNRAISGEFPSGSTIKPVMAAAALAEKIITENTTVLSTGGLHIGQWSFPDWKAGGHGLTDVKKAIAESVNTFFYYIGGGYNDFVGLGMEKINKYFTLFGLGEKTGIDLPGESAGFLPTEQWKEDVKDEAWYIGDTYHVSIGQGDLLTTPLQVANYTAAIANGGTLYQPRLVNNILNEKLQVLEEIKPKVIRNNFIDDNILKIVRAGMRQTVVAGSARSLQSVPVEVAGKTGTAQWSSTKANMAWFTGFAPYDQPTIAITVLVEEGGEGSTIAVPIVNQVLTWYFGDRK